MPHKNGSGGAILDPGRRVICPWCAAELSYSYLSYHKSKYCPMRPERLKAIAADAKGSLDGKPAFSSIKYVEQFFDLNKTNPAQPQLMINPGMGITEIDLTEEYNNMVEVVNPKNKEEKEYECGNCKGHFKERLKYCPHCGIELE